MRERPAEDAGAEGATAPETLRPQDRWDRRRWKEDFALGQYPTEGASGTWGQPRCSGNLSGHGTAGAGLPREATRARQ